MPRMKKKTEYYVNNKEFLEAITVYRNAVIKAREAEDPRPRVPNYIGECFLKIATHLSYKPNFVNYMFREDMICDGIENCLQYIDNFDPEKSKNPFAYFTQIIYYAFLRRIQKEKKQTHIKNKMIENQEYVDFVTLEGDDRKYSVQGFDPTIMLPDEDVYKTKKKEPQSKTSGLENFMENDTWR